MYKNPKRRVSYLSSVVLQLGREIIAWSGNGRTNFNKN